MHTLLKNANFVAILLLAALCLPFAGCGGGGVGDTVSGTVTAGNQPLPAGSVVLTFANAEHSVPAGVEPDGKFTVDLPPGDYKVTLKVVGTDGKDALGGKYDNLATTKTTYKSEGAKSDVKLNVE